MSKKTKTYGPANDEGVGDEIILAMMLQSAKARGLGFCAGTAYRDADGESVSRLFGTEAVSCCAMGALWLDDRPSDISYPVGVPTGNDYPESKVHPGLERGFNIGAAFREAMTDG